MIVPPKFVRYDSSFAFAGTDSVKFLGRTRVRYPGGQYLALFTLEQQFPIAHPLHGVLFFDAGNVWDLWHEIKPFDLKFSAGAGLRIAVRAERPFEKLLATGLTTIISFVCSLKGSAAPGARLASA